MADKFIWTQSALKDLEKAETCPVRWKGLWLDKAWKSVASEAADYGNYFEYLCIGANAKGEAIKDLPRNKDGTKTVVQKRIEQQASVFKDLFDPLGKQFLGYEIKGTQVKLRGTIAGEDTEGTLDIEGINLSNKNNVILDLKLTEDLDNTRTVYGWGNPIDEIDLLQQVLYQQLYFQQHGVLPEMALLVFEHGPKQRVNIIKLNIQEARVESCMERFAAGAQVIERYKSSGWAYDPSEKECRSCPLECSKRYNPTRIRILEVNY